MRAAVAKLLLPVKHFAVWHKGAVVLGALQLRSETWKHFLDCSEIQLHFMTSPACTLLHSLHIVVVVIRICGLLVDILMPSDLSR